MLLAFCLLVCLVQIVVKIIIQQMYWTIHLSRAMVQAIPFLALWLMFHPLFSDVSTKNVHCRQVSMNQHKCSSPTYLKQLSSEEKKQWFRRGAKASSERFIYARKDTGVWPLSARVTLPHTCPARLGQPAQQLRTEWIAADKGSVCGHTNEKKKTAWSILHWK